MADETRPTSSGAEGGGERTQSGDRGERRPPRAGGPGGPGGREGGRKYFRRKKVCKFCVEKIEAINYKDIRLLAQFVAESGRIVPRRLTGVCTPHQRRLSLASTHTRKVELRPLTCGTRSRRRASMWIAARSSSMRRSGRWVNSRFPSSCTRM